MHLRLTPASFLLPLVSLTLTLASISPTFGTFVNLGPAGDYNLYVLNDNTQSGSDSQGKVAVGGNANLGSFTIASSLGNNTDNFIVGGNLTNSGTTFHGGLIVNGNLNWASPTIGGRVGVNGNATFTGGGSVVGPVSVVGTYTKPNYYAPKDSSLPTALPFSFAAVNSYLTSESSFLSAQPSNGTVTTPFSQLHLDANSLLDNYVSFNVTAAQMTNAAGHGLFITAKPGATVVVNVTGGNSSMTNMGFTYNGVDKQHVLFNFVDANALTLSGINVQGTILAPLATVNFSGAIDGTLIARNLQGPGESHLFLFQGNLPSVPEPSTLALAGIGLVALGARQVARRRRVA